MGIIGKVMRTLPLTDRNINNYDAGIISSPNVSGMVPQLHKDREDK